MLPAQNADALLTEVRALLGRYPFAFDVNDAVEIMGGDEEGLFGWVTINYLRNSLHHSHDRTAAVLDLGGGSTQIALSVAPGSATNIKQTTVMGHVHHMYVYSHLGYGLMAGRKGMFGLGLVNTDPRRTGAELEHPCVFPGAKVSYEYGTDKYNVKGSKDGSFAACSAVAAGLVAHPDGSFGGQQPAPQPGQPVFAMSYYYDRAVDAGLVPPSAVRADLQPQQYRKAAEKVCALNPADIPAAFPAVKPNLAPFLCMDLCFIDALLVKGFGLHPTSTVVLAKKLSFNGELVETSWSLGASLTEISEQMGD